MTYSVPSPVLKSVYVVQKKTFKMSSDAKCTEDKSGKSTLRTEEGAILHREVRSGIFEKVIFEWGSEESECEPRKGKNVLSKDHAGTEFPEQELLACSCLNRKEPGVAGAERAGEVEQ